MLVDLFNKNCDIGLAKFLALSVEAGMNDTFQNDTKAYTAKFRTLLANLKRNEVTVRCISSLVTSFYCYCYASFRH